MIINKAHVDSIAKERARKMSTEDLTQALEIFQLMLDGMLLSKTQLLFLKDKVPEYYYKHKTELLNAPLIIEE